MRTVCLALFACAAFAQGTDPKPKPEDYPVQAQAKVLGQTVAVGAEFDIHSFARGDDIYAAPDFVVVEVALYPPKDTAITVNPSQFTLRVNGKKQVLVPQPPGLAAYSASHPEGQSNRPRFNMGGGMGGVGIGTPQRPIGMPGQQPGSPQDDPNAMERKPRTSPQDLATQTALPQGEFKHPVSGFLYFAYKGKNSSIKSLVLVYEDAEIKLR